MAELGQAFRPEDDQGDDQDDDELEGADVPGIRSMVTGLGAIGSEIRQLGMHTRFLVFLAYFRKSAD